MFKVMYPQPENEDISFWELKEYPDLGIGIARNDDGLGFIPFPTDEDPAGAKVVKRNHMWYWSRPHYYNLSHPVTDVREILGPLGIFNDTQLRLIADCLNYSDSYPVGSGGHHQIALITANLYTLLALALNFLPEKRRTDLVEVFHSMTGGER